MQKRLFLLVLVFALMVPFAVMAQDDVVEEIVLPEVDVLDLTGDVITAGSSTVFPLTERMAERFIEAGFSGSITVDSIGSGAGLQRFCQTGETDIANSSRPIRQSEIDFCAALTPPRTPIEFRVGTDALAVVVNVTNDFVDCLTVEQVGRIFSGEFSTWNQVDASYPNSPIGIFSPGTDSGTYDYFLEEALERALKLSREEANRAILSVPGIQFSEDDNVLVQGVEGSPLSIGYFGYAYYVEDQERLKALELDGGDGCVAPNQENVDSATYPFARPLFIYSDAGIMAAKPQVAAFINFYLTNVNNEVIDVGYFPAPVADLNAGKQALLDFLEGGM